MPEAVAITVRSMPVARVHPVIPVGSITSEEPLMVATYAPDKLTPVSPPENVVLAPIVMRAFEAASTLGMLESLITLGVIVAAVPESMLLFRVILAEEKPKIFSSRGSTPGSTKILQSLGREVNQRAAVAGAVVKAK